MRQFNLHIFGVLLTVIAFAPAWGAMRDRPLFVVSDSGVPLSHWRKTVREVGIDEFVQRRSVMLGRDSALSITPLQLECMAHEFARRLGIVLVTVDHGGVSNYRAEGVTFQEAGYSASTRKRTRTRIRSYDPTIMVSPDTSTNVEHLRFSKLRSTEDEKRHYFVVDSVPGVMFTILTRSYKQNDPYLKYRIDLGITCTIYLSAGYKLTLYEWRNVDADRLLGVGMNRVLSEIFVLLKALRYSHFGDSVQVADGVPRPRTNSINTYVSRQNGEISGKGTKQVDNWESRPIALLTCLAKMFAPHSVVNEARVSRLTSFAARRHLDVVWMLLRYQDNRVFLRAEPLGSGIQGSRKGKRLTIELDQSMDYEKLSGRTIISTITIRSPRSKLAITIQGDDDVISSLDQYIRSLTDIDQRLNEARYGNIIECVPCGSTQ